MVLYYQKEDQQIIISGKTYPYRETIKSVGGKFDGLNKTWFVPYSPENMDQIKALCKSVGGGRTKVVTDTNLQKDIEPLQQAHLKKDMGLWQEEDQHPTPTQPCFSNSDHGLTVGELMSQIQKALTKSFNSPIWIIGELQNVSWSKKSCFFKLAEPKNDGSESATTTANATIWNSQVVQLEKKYEQKTLASILQDDLKVRMLCLVNLYKDRGVITLNVLDVDPSYTKGALALAKEQLLKELRAKGLHIKNKQTFLTPFPLLIGLISAEDSRAKSDFLDQLFTYRFPGKVIFYPSQMQGEPILKEVVKGVTSLCEMQCDLIVITRGGGSAADLRWFNSPEIAYAIAQSPIPVIAAIGHHDDVCIAEDISYHREKTPTAAADFLIHHLGLTQKKLDEQAFFLQDALKKRVEYLMKIQLNLPEKLRQVAINRINLQSDWTWKITNNLIFSFNQKFILFQRLLSRSMIQLLIKGKEKLDEQRTTLNRYGSSLHRQSFNLLDAHKESLLARKSLVHHTTHQQFIKFEHKTLNYAGAFYRTTLSQMEKLRQHLHQLEKTVSSLNPVPWVTKGWAQLVSKRGPIQSSHHITVGDTVHARLQDGRVTMTIKRIDQQ